MPCIHYKFFSRLNYDTVTFKSFDVSLGDLKRQIMAREKLKASRCDLEISNAQTGEEYTDENAVIPRNSSVIVRRIPVERVKTPCKTSVLSRTKPVSRTPKSVDDSSASISLAQLTEVADLSSANASEEDKIKAMMIQSCQEYNPINYMKMPPPSNTSLHDGKPGHSIGKGPADEGKHLGPVPRIKKSTGIPRSLLMEVEDPNTKGVMLSNTGKYVIPIVNVEAYAREKKKKPPLLPMESSSSSSDAPAKEQPPLPPSPAPLMAVRPPDALVCPVQNQLALPGRQGLQGQSTPTADHSKEARRIHSAGGRADWEPEKKKSRLDKFTNDFAEELREYEKIPKVQRRSLSRSKSPYRASSHSRSLDSYSESRLGSSCSHSYSQAFSHPNSRSYLPSPPYPGRVRGKSRKSSSRTTSHGYHRSRSRSPADRRRHHSRPKSPVFRRHSPTQRTRPQGEGERDYFNRYTEVPPYNMKAQCDRAVELRDPFEKERYRGQERNEREWYEKFSRGWAVGTHHHPPVNREDFSPDWL